MLVLAAGMGSRYGGLKQLDPVGPNGEVLLDYSVYDASRAGFQRVVFLIRRDFEAMFRSNVLSRYADSLNTELAFQSLDDLPGGVRPLADRTKPWGTGHAVWCARAVIDEPFLVVNADDFYGRQAYETMISELEKMRDKPRQGCMVAYILKNTLSSTGAVSRGICSISAEGKLMTVDESTELKEGDFGVVSGRSQSGSPITLTGDELVSMNFWGFHPEIFSALGRMLSEFLAGESFRDPKSEFYIPQAVAELIFRNELEVNVLKTKAEWMGVTYRDDKPAVAERLRILHDRGEYPAKLWRS